MFNYNLTINTSDIVELECLLDVAYGQECDHAIHALTTQYEKLSWERAEKLINLYNKLQDAECIYE